MVFKVEVYGVRHWVADVDRVDDVWHFELPEGADEKQIDGILFGAPEGSEQHRRVYGGGGSRSVHSVPFGGLTNGVLVRLFCGRRESEFDRVQDWIFPTGCGYLMERGETIDRI